MRLAADYNPIEMAFSKLKAMLQRNRAGVSEYNVQEFFQAALEEVSEQDALGFMRGCRCGYPAPDEARQQEQAAVVVAVVAALLL